VVWLLLGVSLILPGSAHAQAAAPDAASSAAAEAQPSLRLVLFGNVDVLARPPEGEHAGFSMGPLVFYATGRISDHWSALAELVFENDDNTLVTDLERLLLAYEFSDELRFDIGRHHNPLVRWNVTLHHGLFMQTPIERPAMARFEDEPGLWPVHFVGLRVSGRRSDGLGLRYEAGAGNGRGAITDEIQVSGDRNRNKAAFVSLGIGPAFAPGWELYLTGYADRIPAAGGDLRERDFTVATNYLAHGAEVRAEWGRMRHEPVAGGSARNTTGWYVLASRHLPGRAHDVRPYVFLDHLRVAADEAFLAGTPDESSWTAGLRWDASAGAALKFEYRSRKIGAGDREGIVRAQVAVSF
jgi:hypothetical protein